MSLRKPFDGAQVAKIVTQRLSPKGTDRALSRDGRHALRAECGGAGSEAWGRLTA